MRGTRAVPAMLATLALLTTSIAAGGQPAAAGPSRAAGVAAESAQSRAAYGHHPADDRESRNRALVRHVIRRLDAGDVAVIDRTHRADFRYHRPGVPVGTAPITGFWTALLATYPDLSLTIEDIAADRDRVIARITFRGTPVGGDAPLTMHTADVWRVQRGQLAEHWDVVEDPAGMLRRLPAP